MIIHDSETLLVHYLDLFGKVNLTMFRYLPGGITIRVEVELPRKYPHDILMWDDDSDDEEEEEEVDVWAGSPNLIGELDPKTLRPKWVEDAMKPTASELEAEEDDGGL
jgi:hypothetical protein